MKPESRLPRWVSILWIVAVFVVWGLAADALKNLRASLPDSVPFWALHLATASALALAAGLLVYILRRFARAPQMVWLGVLAWAVVEALVAALYIGWVVPASPLIAREMDMSLTELLGWTPSWPNKVLYIALVSLQLVAALAGAVVGSRLAQQTSSTANKRIKLTA